MEVFHVKPNDVIVVHQRIPLFRFQVAASTPGKASIDLYLPLYSGDGRPTYLENLQSDTVHIGETNTFEQEEHKGLGIEAGMVEITVASVDGESAAVYVQTPDGWGALKEDDVADQRSEEGEK